MYRYSRTEFDRVLKFVRGLYEPRSAEGLIDYLLPAIRTLVPLAFAGSASYELGVAARTPSGRTDPPDLVSAEMEARLAELAPRSPMAIHFRRTRSEQFMRWSDVQPIPQFMRTAFYNEIYRPWGIKDLCTLFLRTRPDRFEFLGVGLAKRIPDAHRDMLVSISGHVQQAVRLAHTTSALIAMTGTTNGSNCTERSLMSIARDGTIAAAPAPALRALAKFFPERTRRGMPAQLWQWIASSEETMRNAADVPDVRRPLMIERDGGRLVVHLFSTPEQRILLFEEQRRTLNPAALSKLPLTRRESEVLSYVAFGKTDREIGIILGISPRTVSKHVEHILEELGVETRTAAAACALQAEQSSRESNRWNRPRIAD